MKKIQRNIPNVQMNIPKKLKNQIRSFARSKNLQIL